MLLAYNHATGYEMPMNVSVERWICEAIAEGLTPEDVTLSIQSRKQFNARNSAQKSLMLHRMLMSSDDRAVVLNEAAEVRARRRVRVMDAGKAEVLRATGRPDTLPSPEAKHVSETQVIKAIEALRKAAG